MLTTCVCAGWGRRLAAGAGVLGLLALAATLGWPTRQPVAAAEVPVKLFESVAPAPDAAAIVLESDGPGVRGWVAGAKSFAGQSVKVHVNGETIDAKVQADNTFAATLPPFAEPAGPVAGSPHRAVTATLERPAPDAALSRGVSMPRAEGPKRSVFFVTDRTAYRPGHKLNFAGYVRAMTEAGEFEPVKDTAITVDITSQTRAIRAARLELRTDDFGRIAGDYTFTDADTLDFYTLKATGFVGEAQVVLGEYRKTKVAFTLSGTVQGAKLKVDFTAKDFVGRAVNGKSASYTATVVRQGWKPTRPLDAAKFAHPVELPPTQDELDQLPTEERLLALAHGVTQWTFAGLQPTTVAGREGTVTFPATGPGQAELALKPEWLTGDHQVHIQAVMIDEMGRENRASAVIPLKESAGGRVAVSVPKETFAAGESIAVTVAKLGGENGAAVATQPATTVLLCRLQPETGAAGVIFDPDEMPAGLSGRMVAIPTGKPVKPASPQLPEWTNAPAARPIRQTIESTVGMKGDAGTLTVHRPGAYKLLALTTNPDGTTQQSEAGFVVLPAAKIPAIVLKLRDAEVGAGERLRGEVHSRFSGAKVWLTLRDGTGVRLNQVLTTPANGVAAFDVPLPANLRYGCTVTAHLVEGETARHADQRQYFVRPTDRTIQVTAKAPAEVGPGSEVLLDVSVNRTEPVDLLVSVFDESLLAVQGAGKLRRDIRDFYLADRAGQATAARELAMNRFGHLRIADLVKQANELLKGMNRDRGGRAPGFGGPAGFDPNDSGLHQALTQLVQNHQNGNLNGLDVATLLRLAGCEVVPGFLQHAAVDIKRSTRLADLFQPNAHGRIQAAMIQNTVLLTFAGPGQEEAAWAMLRSGQGLGIHGYNGIGLNPAFHGHRFGFAGQYGINGVYYPQNGQGFGGFQFGQGGFNGYNCFGGGFAGQGGFGGQGGVSRGEAAFSSGQAAMSANSAFSVPAGFSPLPPIGGAAELGANTDLGSGTIRRDFSDSAFWSAAIRTDAAGSATVKFKLPDSLTNWRVVVTAVGAKMHVGQGSASVRVSRPVMVWPILPRAFTEGDSVAIYGTVHNLTDKPQQLKVECQVKNGELASPPQQAVTVPPMGNVPVYWTYRAGKVGVTEILMSAVGDGGKDASLKRIPVTSGTVEERSTAAGLVGRGNLAFTLPEGFDPKHAKVTVTLAPTVAADLGDTLPYLVEYPYGCVEQTMSRFLPAIKVAGILKQAGIANKELEAKLPKVAEAGIKRLLELQQPDGGWGWLGTTQTHEMMTPYALMGLLEAEKAGYTIPNETAVARGVAALTQQIQRLRQQIDVARGVTERSKNPARAALVNDWVYGVSVLAKHEVLRGTEYDDFAALAETGDLSDYSLGLALAMAAHGKRPDLAAHLVEKLRARAKKLGDATHWTTAGFSRWADNANEVTAVVLQGLVAHDPASDLIPSVLAYFLTTKRGDRWDSTKDTACVLYALCDYLQATKAKPGASGGVKARLNGDDWNAATTLDGAKSVTITLPAASLKPGPNVLNFQADEATHPALARLMVRYVRDETAIPARNHGIEVTRTLSVRNADGNTWKELKSGATVPVGSYVRVQVRAAPAGNAVQRYLLVESPKPAGGETVPAEDQRFAKHLQTNAVLREDREAMTSFSYEEIATAHADYVFLAEFAGAYRVPPARAELMYTPTVGGHSDSFMLTVK